MEKRARYVYDGPVLEFDRVATNRWTSSTYATSIGQARSNLAYQYKKQFNKTPTTKITLPGKIEQIG